MFQGLFGGLTTDMNTVVGTHDLALITLESLRYDVAAVELNTGRTPNLAGILPKGWEQRHTSGTFSYASHAAMLAGFLPTPARPGRHPRPLALRFDGSETTSPLTCVLEGGSIVEGLANRGYYTLCIGGSAFFNPQTPLGRVLPSLFAEHHWEPRMGPTDPRSLENQIDVLDVALQRIPRDRRAFTLVNIAAVHPPNHFYALDAKRDTLATHAAALRYVDTQIPRLFKVLCRRGPLFTFICSSHGTAYGEEGYVGHRVAHPFVTTVPYAEVVIS